MKKDWEFFFNSKAEWLVGQIRDWQLLKLADSFSCPFNISLTCSKCLMKLFTSVPWETSHALSLFPRDKTFFSWSVGNLAVTLRSITLQWTDPGAQEVSTQCTEINRDSDVCQGLGVGKGDVWRFLLLSEAWKNYERTIV